MTFILDMATGAENPLEAPGYQRADTVKAHQSGQCQQQNSVELRLEVVQMTPTDHRSAIPLGVDIAELISKAQD
jgi:hypothetical protein